jgi:hypothetical protein
MSYQSYINQAVTKTQTEMKQNALVILGSPGNSPHHLSYDVLTVVLRRAGLQVILGHQPWDLGSLNPAVCELGCDSSFLPPGEAEPESELSSSSVCPQQTNLLLT